MKLYSFIFISGIMVLLLVYFLLIFVNIQAKTTLMELKDERVALENEILVLKQYEDLQNQVIYVNNTYEKIMANFPDWQDILVNIGMRIPDSVWLTDLTTTNNTSDENPTGGNILIKGSALNNALVASWVEEIRAIPYINEANLTSATKKTIDNQEVVQFEIKAVVESGKYDQPFSKGAGK